jgi:hypothetical protein
MRTASHGVYFFLVLVLLQDANKETLFVLNKPTSPQTTLAAEAHEGRIFTRKADI